MSSCYNKRDPVYLKEQTLPTKDKMHFQVRTPEPDNYDEDSQRFFNSQSVVNHVMNTSHNFTYLLLSLNSINLLITF